VIARSEIRETASLGIRRPSYLPSVRLYNADWITATAAATRGRDLHARADCYKVTRSVAFVRCRADEHDPAEAFASAAGMFMLGVYAVGSPPASREPKTGRGRGS